MRRSIDGLRWRIEGDRAHGAALSFQSVCPRCGQKEVLQHYDLPAGTECTQRTASHLGCADPPKRKTRKPAKPAGNFSGVDENRTHNLLNAIQALCQLSYHPCNQTTKSITSRVENAPRIEVTFFRAIRHSQSRERRARAKSRYASDASVRPISP